MAEEGGTKGEGNISPIRRVVIISAGASHSVALLSGDVVCSWGRGEDGQLGHGDAEDRMLPTQLSALDGHEIVSVTCGADHTTAFSEARMQVYSWGWGDFGRLGHGNSSDLFTPQPVKALQGLQIKQIACGDSHCLAVTMEGEVQSWGRNQNGQLGLGTTEDSLLPQKIDAFQGISVKMVATGAEHSAAVTENGELYGWGWGRYGNLGLGDRNDRLLPQKVSSIEGENMILVACGWRHTISVSSDGGVYTYGWSKYGQLGHGDFEDRLIPHRLEALCDKSVSQISGGWRHTMALTSDGKLYGWGWNKFGQVGVGDNVDHCSPAQVRIPDEQKVVQISCGWRHTLAVTESHNVFSWGRGTNGQLGDGESSDRNIPTIIKSFSGADNWIQCLEVFRWMQKQRWYIADNGVYSKLISVMGKKGQTRMAMWLFSEMRNSGCRPDTSVYNALITAHLHSRDKTKALSKSLGYFDKMKGMERCKPNIVTYNILLRAFAQARNVNKVETLFKDLKESIVSPDIYTYNGVMDAYGKNGMIREMELVLSKMKSNQCKPDIITFNLLIDAYGRKQEFDKMEQVFKSLLRSKFKPTVPTFNSMLTNYGKARLREKADYVYQKMTEMGYTPSFVTYECMILMYGYCNCLSKARDIFDGLIESGKEMKVSTLNAMLDVYCMNGLPMEADMLFDSARIAGISPDSSTYKLLYKAYTKANMKELLEKLLKQMDKDGIIPNKKFFLDTLGAFGSLSVALESPVFRRGNNRLLDTVKS